MFRLLIMKVSAAVTVTPGVAGGGSVAMCEQWFDWLLIYDLSAADVFVVIAEAGQAPYWAYATGMARLSCSFCILASPANRRRAA